MTNRRRLTIPLDHVGAAGALWLLAIALMVVESATDASGRVARWAILVGVGAATMTLVAVVQHARRVVLDVISWEAQRTRTMLAEKGIERVSQLADRR